MSGDAKANQQPEPSRAGRIFGVLQRGTSIYSGVWKVLIFLKQTQFGSTNSALPANPALFLDYARAEIVAASAQVAAHIHKEMVDEHAKNKDGEYIKKDGKEDDEQQLVKNPEKADNIDRASLALRLGGAFLVNYAVRMDTGDAPEEEALATRVKWFIPGLILNILSATLRPLCAGVASLANGCKATSSKAQRVITAINTAAAYTLFAAAIITITNSGIGDVFDRSGATPPIEPTDTQQDAALMVVISQSLLIVSNLLSAINMATPTSWKFWQRSSNERVPLLGKDQPQVQSDVSAADPEDPQARPTGANDQPRHCPCFG